MHEPTRQKPTGWPTLPSQTPVPPPVAPGATNPPGGSPPPPDDPGGSSSGTPRGLFAVLGVVGLVLVVMLGLTIYWVSSDGDGDDSAAGDPTASDTADEPTDDASEPASAPASSDEPTTPAPRTSAPPASGNRVQASDYDGDWDFKLDGREAYARYQQGWDHATCEPVDPEGRLAEWGCAYAVEVTYRTREGDLQLTNVFLAMPDEAAATKVTNQLATEDFDVRAASLHPDYEPDQGQGLWRVTSTAEIVVITLVTTEPGVADERMENYLEWANSDFSAALLFR